MDRAKKIERLLALQTRIHRLAEWRLVEIDRKQASVAESRERLFDTLNGDQPLHGLFADAMARRIAALARESDRLQRAREAQERRLREEGLKLKRFERAGEKINRKSRDEAAKKSFAALLDVLANVDDASLP
jgi:hypothetical protein